MFFFKMEEVCEISRKRSIKLKSTELEIDSYVPLHFDCDERVLKLTVLLEECRHIHRVFQHSGHGTDRHSTGTVGRRQNPRLLLTSLSLLLT